MRERDKKIIGLGKLVQKETLLYRVIHSI